jgi:hypothetical protein
MIAPLFKEFAAVLSRPLRRKLASWHDHGIVQYYSIICTYSMMTV